jgi:glycerophosphoryl diester phosphodiesterase
MTKLPAVVGHRGWPTRFPDNTLAGLLAASTVADAAEVDVRRSADGKLVLSHDPTLGGLEVASHPWSTLGEVDLGDGHKPALLDEVLSGVPDLPLELEIKNLPDQPGFEPDHRVALEAAERARPGDILTSFNWDSLAAVRRVFPEVATGVLVGGSGDIDVAIEECLSGGHPALIPSIHLPSFGFTRALEAGLTVIPWVVDDAALAVELAVLGVSGILTDDPALVRAAIGRNS